MPRETRDALAARPGTRADIEATIEAMAFRSLSPGIGIGAVRNATPGAKTHEAAGTNEFNRAGAATRGASMASTPTPRRGRVVPSAPQVTSIRGLPEGVTVAGLQTASAPGGGRQAMSDASFQSTSSPALAPQAQSPKYASAQRLPVTARLSRFLAATFLDGVVVLLTLVVALTLAGFVVAWDGRPASMTQSTAPLRWVWALGPLVMSGIYASVFVVYALSMRLVAGASIGRALIPREHGPERVSISARS